MKLALSKLRPPLSPFLYCLLLVPVLFLTGCSAKKSAPVPEVEDATFRRGRQLLREGRREESLSAFLKVIDARQSQAPESHLEAGQLYLNALKDPVTAIYHLRRHLEQQPESRQAPMVRQLIQTARKEFARQLPGRPQDEPTVRSDLMAVLQQLRQENLFLRRELAQVRRNGGIPRFSPMLTQNSLPVSAQSLKTAGAGAPSPLPNPWQAAAGEAARNRSTGTGAGSSTYTVQAGDTLSLISRKVYGSTGKWKQILDANRATLNSPTDLQVGQELVIPR